MPFVISLALFVFPTQLARLDAERLVLWSVQKGQFLSLLRPHECIHFGMTGEVQIWNALAPDCQRKRNTIVIRDFTTRDLGVLKKFNGRIWNLCLASLLNSLAPKEIIPCKDSVEGIFAWHPNQVFPVAKATRRNTEGQLASAFYLKDFGILIPGSSVPAQRRQWLKWASPFRPKILILPTSRHFDLSAEELDLLPDVRSVVLAPTRKSKREIPLNKATRERLKTKAVHITVTRPWGHLHFLKETSAPYTR